MNSKSVWTLVGCTDVPITIHFENSMVIIHTHVNVDKYVLATVWMQNLDDKRVCWVTKDAGRILGYRGDLVETCLSSITSRNSNAPTEFYSVGERKAVPEDILWMLKLMRRAESFRREALPEWADNWWKMAKSYIVRAYIYDLGGKRVWWNCDVRIRFKKTDEGMAALVKLLHTVQFGVGFHAHIATEAEMEMTVRHGSWLGVPTKTQVVEYVIVPTFDFDQRSVAWFMEEIFPALEELEVQ